MTGRLAADWPRIARRLARAGRVAVLTDFDGTLAPIHRHAAAVRLSARVRGALAQLKAEGHVVGVISGRPLHDLRRRVGVRGLWYAGDHGFFLRSPEGATLRLVRPTQIAAIAQVTRELRRGLAGLRGVTIEFKRASVAVHYRGAPATSHRAATRAVRRLARSATGLRLLAGKCVWEILPRVPVDKAVAVRAILDAERGHRPGRDLPAVFIGDDVTDEPVFAMRLALSVAVGRRRSAAVYRLRSPADVLRLLERILALRT